jgi:hypothetical protein
MARIRTIKPDAFMSDSLSRVPRGVRWTFAGLWTYLDDEGRGRDDVRLIKAALYPLDDDVALSMLTDDLKQLEHIGCICRYEADGKTYMHAPGWGDHQRVSHPTPSKLPRCSRHDPDPFLKPPEEFVKPPEPLRPEGKGKEQGKEGKGTRARATSSDPLFDEFWAAYPRKTDKGNARKAWDKAVKKTDGRTIILAAAALAASKPDLKFTAHPSTWLNGERWDDQPLTLIAGGRNPDGSRPAYAKDDVRARFQ